MSADPYRGSAPPNAVVKVFEELMSEHKAAAKTTPRGAFCVIGDSGLEARIILAAVAHVVAPLVVEVMKLRQEVRRSS